MAQVTRSRTIAASPADVWEVLADFGGLQAWVPSITHSNLTTETTAGPGTARRVQTGRTVIIETVVDWQPETTLAYRIDGLPSVVTAAENRWTITPAADRVDVAITSTVDTGSRPPRKAVARVVTRILAKVSDRLLDGLDRRLTIGGPAAPGASRPTDTAATTEETEHG